MMMTIMMMMMKMVHHDDDNGEECDDGDDNDDHGDDGGVSHIPEYPLMVPVCLDENNNTRISTPSPIPVITSAIYYGVLQANIFKMFRCFFGGVKSGLGTSIFRLLVVPLFGRGGIGGGRLGVSVPTDQGLPAC